MIPDGVAESEPTKVQRRPVVRPWRRTEPSGHAVVLETVLGREIPNDLGLNVWDDWEWETRAVCANADYPPPEGIAKQKLFVKGYCAYCPVRRECLQLGMETAAGRFGARPELAGIWGGLTARRIRELIRVEEREEPLAV